MATSKYDSVMKDVHSYIRNRVELKTSKEMIVSEVISRFPTFVRFYNVAQKMQIAFIETLVDQCWYDVYDHHKR